MQHILYVLYWLSKFGLRVLKSLIGYRMRFYVFSTPNLTDNCETFYSTSLCLSLSGAEPGFTRNQPLEQSFPESLIHSYSLCPRKSHKPRIDLAEDKYIIICN